MPSDTLAASVNVQIESSEMVEPAEPTERSRLNLSNIDQMVMFYLSLVFFYPALPAKWDFHRDYVRRIRAALQKLLVPYHFMAGRVAMDSGNGRLYVDCNRAGVLLLVASCDSEMSDLGDLAQPNPAFCKFAQWNLHCDTLQDAPLFMIQFTKLKCGGVVIGAATSHGIMDAQAAFEAFMNLASMARGEGLLMEPVADRISLQARNPPQVKFQHPELLQLSNNNNNDDHVQAQILRSTFTTMQSIKLSTVSRGLGVPKGYSFATFPYSGEMVRKLKQQILQQEHQEGAKVLRKCSAFEAMAAVIWKAYTLASPMADEDESKLLFPVNLRSRLNNPALPLGFCGNAVTVRLCRTSAGVVRRQPLAMCVAHVQEAVATLTDEYLRSLIDLTHMSPCVPNSLGAISVTTLLHMPFEAADFGTGPAVASTIVASAKMVELATLLRKRNPDNGGVSVYVGLPHNVLRRFAHFIYNVDCRL